MYYHKKCVSPMNLFRPSNRSVVLRQILGLAGVLYQRVAVNSRNVSRLLLTQRFLTFRYVPCVKIKDTDDVLPVKEGPQLP